LYLANRKLLSGPPLLTKKTEALFAPFRRDSFFLAHQKEKYSDKYICLRCKKLYQINSRGFIQLCNGRQLFAAKYLSSKEDIFGLFEKLANLGDTNKRNCPYFPSRKRTLYLCRIQLIEEKVEKFLGSKDYKKIISLLENLDRKLVKNWFLYYAQGVAYYKIGHFDAAHNALRMARLLNPDNGNIEYSIGICLRAMGKFEESVEYIMRGHKNRGSDNILLS